MKTVQIITAFEIQIVLKKMEIAADDSKNPTVVINLDETLLRHHSSFPFFALVAFDVGGVLRLLFVLLASPFSWVSSQFISVSAGFRVLIFATLAGMKLSDIESAARAVLPKFYSTDLHPEAWRAFSSRGKKCVVTAFPRVMVEDYFKNSLGADMVLGTEIGCYRGRATGFLVKNKAIALEKVHIWLEDRQIFAGEKLIPKSIIFHDGRLVQKPTPLMALYIIIWFPVGFVLALLRGVIIILCPIQVLYYTLWALGVRIYINGTLPPVKKSTGQTGVLFACSHRTLLEGLMVSIAIGRPITSVTYSMSAISEMLSPIKTVRLSRDRSQDACTIKKLLDEGDLVICPEGTTCREPILLRFSALFAELTDQIVPVAMASKMSMFHGTTVRGWKAMDPIYFLMNPSPTYEVTFLNKLPQEMTCSAGKSCHDVANYVQGLIAESLGYECTRFTRKDKYRALAGNDGVIGKALR